MQIDRSSWHYRVFAFMAQVSERTFTFLDHRATYREHIDLCTYIRTITFTGPLALGLTAATWGYVFYVFVWWPATHNAAAVTSLGWVVFLVIAGLIVFGHLCYLWWFVAEERRLARQRRQEVLDAAQLSAERQGTSPPAPLPAPGFREVWWEWVKAKKQQICPVFDVRG